ncbi:MAG: hypothetical protein Kow0068_03580 [Marinilabiliales bacterium]
MSDIIKYQIITFIIIAALSSCKKEKVLNDSNIKLAFSEDTVIFDTVFTNIGSVTKQFKVYNNYKQAIKISQISLAGGDQSQYRLNIDGYPVNNLSDVIIEPEDSIFVFVEVTVNPANINNPFVVQDSVVFYINGNMQDVNLVAWGQDANYISGKMITNDTVWTSERPFLIYNSVGIDSNVTLTIEEGTQIYFHKNSGMIVWGTLIVNGSYDNPVVFQGDRLESYYDDIPGQWGGIRFNSGSGAHSMNWVIIKNAIVGIQIGTLESNNPQSLVLSNAIITNMNYAGIYSLTSTIKAYNCLIANCGFYAVALLVGGDYEFYHCTVANYWKYGNRIDPSVVITNNAQFGENLFVGDLTNAYWGNSIITGSKDDELGIGVDAGAQFNYLIDHCLLKGKNLDTTDGNHYTNILLNSDPKFVDINELNFELDTLSDAIDAGSINIVNTNLQILQYDLKNESRIIDNQPDLGAYERIE